MIVMNATSHTFNLYPMEHHRSIGRGNSVDSLNALGLDDFLVPNPMNTVLFRAKDDKLSSEGIFKGDLLVVDRSLKPEPSQIVVLNEESQLTLRYFLRPRVNVLNAYSPYAEFSDQMNGLIALESMNIWGVVTYCLHRLNSV
jgi:DNA polymerase V